MVTASLASASPSLSDFVIEFGGLWLSAAASGVPRDLRPRGRMVSEESGCRWTGVDGCGDDQGSTLRYYFLIWNMPMQHPSPLTGAAVSSSWAGSVVRKQSKHPPRPETTDKDVGKTETFTLIVSTARVS